MALLEIRSVTHRRDRERFIALPYALYEGDRCWTPPLRRDTRELLDERRNPFFEHASLAAFLALRDGRVLGRIAAIESRRHEETHQDGAGFFGFFECEKDQDAATALVEAAAAWCRSHDKSLIRGPVSPSMNDEAGLLVDGFDTPAVLMMPHNPPFYGPLLEGTGLRKAMDLLAYQPTSTEPPPRLARGVARLTSHLNVKLRTLDMRRFDSELAPQAPLQRRVGEELGFRSHDGPRDGPLAKQLVPSSCPSLRSSPSTRARPSLRPRVPDLAVALRRTRGRLFPGIVRVLLAARHLARVRISPSGRSPSGDRRPSTQFSIITSGARGAGSGSTGARRAGSETNALMRNALERMGFAPYKTYRIYERPL